MKVNKDAMLADIKRQQRYLDGVRAIVDVLPDELPDGVYYRAGIWAVYLDIPYDFEMYRKVRRCLRDWTVSNVLDNNENGEKFYILHPPNEDSYGHVGLYITLKPSMSNSKCRVEVVGKREVEVVRTVCV